MTHAGALLDYYELKIQRILLDAYACASVSSAQDREPETAERIALCQARKAAQLARARQVGLLEEMPHDDR